MHPVVLIPLATAFGAAALAAAIAAREPGQRANRLVAAVLLCDVWWALFEVLCLTAQRRQRGPALRAAGDGRQHPALAGRAAPAGGGGARAAAPLPPAAHGPVRDRRRPSCSRASAAPGSCPASRGTSWGFAPVIGPLVPVGLPGPAAGAPDRAVAGAATAHAGSACRDRARARGSRSPSASPCWWPRSPTSCCPPRPAAFPGSAARASPLWGLVTWWMVYRFRGSGLSPRQFASEILATLPDGVALVRLDGRIRALNAKLAQLAKRAPDDLLGRPLDELVIEPAEAAARRRARERADERIGRARAGLALGRLAARRHRLCHRARARGARSRGAGLAAQPPAHVGAPRGGGTARGGHRARDQQPDRLRALERGPARAALEGRSPPRSSRARRRRRCIAALTRSRELLRAAADGIDRIASIVRDVGGFSWKGGSENEPADPVELLETAVRVAGPQLRRKASVERSFAKLPLVPCRPQELMQVFLNLVLAGVHTIEQHGRLRLSRRNRRRLRLGRDRGRRRRARARGPGADLRPLLAVARRRGAGRARARDLAADRGAPGRPDPGRVAAGARHALSRVTCRSTPAPAEASD